jgi:hypothetical protein
MSTDTSNALPPVGNNPLKKFFRQPAIYISLPSGGRFWPEGSIDMPENGEIPIYPMTSRDEITLRTPDALLNGQGVVDVIHSCAPNIKNAWKMPSIDVDAVLIAMRIASYGHSMDFENKCPHCGEQHTYGMDLRHMMSTIRCPDYDQNVDAGPVKLTFEPQSYFEVNKANQISFEAARLSAAIEQLPNSDEKQTQASMQMGRLVELNQMAMANSTAGIQDIESGEVITDKEFIVEFYKNIDSKLFNEIQEKMLELVKDSSIKPVPVSCQSCGGQIDLTILFDYANFFVVGS